MIWVAERMFWRFEDLERVFWSILLRNTDSRGILTDIVNGDRSVCEDIKCVSGRQTKLPRNILPRLWGMLICACPSFSPKIQRHPCQLTFMLRDNSLLTSHTNSIPSRDAGVSRQ